MRRLLRWIFGLDNVAARPTRAEQRERDVLRDVEARLERLEDLIESHKDRMDRMRARISSLRRDLGTDDDEPDEQDELLDLINERRGNSG